jgi:hypothetical protein
VEAPLHKTERRTGVMEKFDHSESTAHGFVRVGDERYFVPASTRGVLQPDGSIQLCANGDRYGAIPAGAKIAIDLVYLHGKASPGPWAPKCRPQR